MSRLFPFTSPIDISIRLDDAEEREQVDVKLDKDRRQSCPVYHDGDTVKGKIVIRSRDGRETRHEGIRVEFVGSIELFYDRGNRYEFLAMAQEIAAPGELRAIETLPFEFRKVEMPYESYHGINVKLRYVVQVTVGKKLNPVQREREIWLHSYRMPFDTNNAIKMEVGIEDCLHIEFEYNRSKYHLKDVIVGKIFFLLVRIKIKHMELSIIRRETTGSPPNQYNESETITKFEIMDGAPLKGETIPIRLFLSGFELTPTYRDVNKKFSTRYYLNLVLIDEENRRYFKQQEITIYRLDPRVEGAVLEGDALEAVESVPAIEGVERVPATESVKHVPVDAGTLSAQPGSAGRDATQIGDRDHENGTAPPHSTETDGFVAAEDPTVPSGDGALPVERNGSDSSRGNILGQEIAELDAHLEHMAVGPRHPDPGFDEEPNAWADA